MSDAILACRRVLTGEQTPIQRIHDLKVARRFWAAIVLNNKTFEIRKNDRDYKVGDDLLIRGWSTDDGCYTGEWLLAYVPFILDEERWGMQPNHIIMSVKCYAHGYRDGDWCDAPDISTKILSNLA